VTVFEAFRKGFVRFMASSCNPATVFVVVHIPDSRSVLLRGVFGAFLDVNFFTASAALRSLSAVMAFLAKHQLGKPVGEENNCFKIVCVGNRQGKVLGREGGGGSVG
jgi:hypothetical protein